MNCSRRDFLKSSTVGVSVLSLIASLDEALSAADTTLSAKSGTVFSPSNDILWRGMFGEAYKKSLDRLGQKPLDTVDFILADVNFNQKRRFTNYSGDISGRFIETTSLTSTANRPQPEILAQVIEQIVAFQKPDGHYGAPVEWDKPVDIAGATDQSLEMPILWGNGRLLLGLLAAYERFGNTEALESAKKLGDFYIQIVVPRFCDPNRKAEYSQQAAGYAAAYVTCVFHGIEGLVRCWRLTGERKYLDAALNMADFHEPFDTLPVGHSHGSISTHEALMMLYEETGDEKYLRRVVERWEKAVGQGYVNPCGGVAEKYQIGYGTDEGCSEADLLRLNLMLWRDTHEARYLDFAERLLFNAYLANQWPSGGFGHRRLGFDDLGVYAWLEPVAESFWCCSFHGPLGYYELKEFFAVGTDEHQKTILYNFPLDFSAPIQFSDALWTVDSTPLPPNADAPVRTAVRLTPDRSDAETALSVRLPDWAGRLVVRLGSRELAGTVAHGRWNADEPIRGAVELEIDFLARPFLEDRRFQKIEIPDTLPTEFPEAVLRWGPNVYLMKIDGEPKIPDLALNVDKGRLALPEAAVCMADLSAEERAGKFAFVFRAKLNQA